MFAIVYLSNYSTCLILVDRTSNILIADPCFRFHSNRLRKSIPIKFQFEQFHCSIAFIYREGQTIVSIEPVANRSLLNSHTQQQQQKNGNRLSLRPYQFWKCSSSDRFKIGIRVLARVLISRVESEDR